MKNSSKDLKVPGRCPDNNENFSICVALRIIYLKRLVASGLLIGLVLSKKLWTQDRYFPRIPVLNCSWVLPTSFENSLFFVLLCLLSVLIFIRGSRILILFICFISVLYVLSDQMRLQPWFYQYNFMLLVLAFCSWRKPDARQQYFLLNSCRVIVASIYFFSGLSKLNPVFVVSVFPWVIKPITNLLPDSLALSFMLLGVLVPFIEMGMGIGLLTIRYRNSAIVLVALMHTLLLVCLGPLGHSWNSVVWPWNIIMILLVLTLFGREKNLSFSEIFWVNKTFIHRLVLIFFALMPILSFINLWNPYLSSALYAGNSDRARISFNESTKLMLPKELQAYIQISKQGGYQLDINAWSNDELNVPPFPSANVYKSLARRICEITDESGEIGLELKPRKTILFESPADKFRCAELGLSCDLKRH